MNTLHCLWPDAGINGTVADGVVFAAAPWRVDRASSMTEKTFVQILEDATDRSRDMNVPLGQRLKAVADEVRRLSPEFAEIVAAVSLARMV